MIDEKTVQRVFDAVDIVEVVQDFVNLKKRGANYIGLCPFHNEKTPSFVVSPSKGIFKCFGCGEAGNAVSFVMKIENISFPEAIKFLGKKYNIEIKEEAAGEEQLKEKQNRESLLIVTSFAAKFFTDNLFNTDEGISVGLSYLRSRGLTDGVIEKFQLGYSPEKRNALTQEALSKGYKLEFLEKSGLTIVNDYGQHDRFHGRIIFPIHSIGGKIIAFGARTLKTDKKIAKYLNSPESEIYHKSDTLYGIFFAKKSIVSHDKCYMVEGYTDVLSLHQSGISNVVASSGTSLTQNQIRLVKRLSQNITFIYDGDKAGIKASLRGINLVLEEGMNVKVVPLPEGEDPDSFSKKISPSELIEYIENNEQDFIHFKTNLLKEEAGNDPIKKSNLINDIVRTIAVIPNSILRSVYVKECSNILEVEEQSLYDEINKILYKKRSKEYNRLKNKEKNSKPQTESVQLPSYVKHVFSDVEEKEIIYFLLNFGNEVIETDEEGVNTTVAAYIIAEVINDDMQFENLLYKNIFEEYKNKLLENEYVNVNYFLYHSDISISKLAADLITEKYIPSKIWQKKGNMVETPDKTFKDDVFKAINKFKLRIVMKYIDEIMNKIKNTDYNNTEELKKLLEQKKQLDEIKQTIANDLNITII